MINGLYSYEVVLLALGAAFFLVLLAGFIHLLWRDKPYSKLLPFFCFPVVMIGYPSIKSIQYQDGIVTLEKTTDQLQRDPTNPTLRETLNKQLAQTADRPGSAPGALVAIAAAQFALGNHMGAKAHLDQALQAGPALPKATELKKRIEFDDKLTALTQEVERNPGNAVAKAQLGQAANQVSQLPVASPVLLNKMARAQAVLGNNAAAESLASKVRKIDPRMAAIK